MRTLFCLLLVLSSMAWGRTQGTTTACKSNLRNLAAALEMYASDHRGRYPETLNGLVDGGYLPALPCCPAARVDTYSSNYVRETQPDRFALCCAGDHHLKARLPLHYPSYDSEAGLRDGILDDIPAEVGPCLQQLQRVARALRDYHRDHSGRYPLQLEQLVPGYLDTLPQCPAGPLTLGKRDGRWQVSCPATAHLHLGLAPFQPAWVENRTSLTRRALQEVTWQPRATPPDRVAVWVITLSSGVLVVCTLGRGTQGVVLNLAPLARREM